LLEIFEISEFSLIDDEGQVFRINTKLLSNPVTELKICENHSHCWSIVLKTMDRSIVKQLEREKNSNFDVENFVVMFIY
jgi:glutamine synthetase adenylyltransferase